MNDRADRVPRLIVGISRSRASWWALAWAVGEARRRGARLLLVNVFRPPVTIDAASTGKRYGTVGAVRDVPFSIGRGEVFAFRGPNGAEKTTTVRMLWTLTRPGDGQARVGRAHVHRRFGGFGHGTVFQAPGKDLERLRGRRDLALKPADTAGVATSPGPGQLLTGWAWSWLWACLRCSASALT